MEPIIKRELIVRIMAVVAFILVVVTFTSYKFSVEEASRLDILFFIFSLIPYGILLYLTFFEASAGQSLVLLIGSIIIVVSFIIPFLSWLFFNENNPFQQGMIVIALWQIASSVILFIILRAHDALVGGE